MAFKPFALLFRPIGVCVGFIYPAYASFKALESKSPEAAGQWLTYWVVFSQFTIFEYFADWLISWLPLYYIGKAAFILWLQLPQTQGASHLYIQWIAPFVKKHEEEIDRYLEEGRKKAERSLGDVKEKGMTWFSQQGMVKRSTGGGGGGDTALSGEEMS